MDFTFRGSYIGSSRGPEPGYYWVPAGSAAHLNTDEKDDQGADVPEYPNWPWLLPSTEPVVVPAPSSLAQTRAPAPDGIQLAVDVQAYRIKVAGNGMAGRLAKSLEKVTLVVAESLLDVKAANDSSDAGHGGSSRRS